MNALEVLAVFLGVMAGIRLLRALIAAGVEHEEDDGPDAPPPPPDPSGSGA